jgi:energy-converting hydrogenase Eha subunit A
VDTQIAVNTAIPLAIFMAYHLIPRTANLPILGTRTNTKTHLATSFMIASEIALISKEYPSKTFAVLASFAAPIIAFGAGLNINKLLGHKIDQTTAVKMGRMMVALMDFMVVPAFWYWYHATCSDFGDQVD